AIGLFDHGFEEVDSAELRINRQGFLDKRLGRVSLSFLDQGPGHVEPAIGVFRLSFGDSREGVLSALQIALQEQSDAPIVPTLAILLADDGLPGRLAEFELRLRLRQSDDRDVGDFILYLSRNISWDVRLFEGVFETVVVLTDERGVLTWFGLAGIGELRVVMRELAVIQLGRQGNGTPNISRNFHPEVRHVGGARRNEPHIKNTARLAAPALVYGVAFRVELVGTVEVSASLDRAFAVVLHPTAPINDAPVGILPLQFEPHVKSVDRATREEVADLTRADDHIH